MIFDLGEDFFSTKLFIINTLLVYFFVKKNNKNAKSKNIFNFVKVANTYNMSNLLNINSMFSMCGAF